MTLPQAAQSLGVSRRTVERYVQAGRLTRRLVQLHGQAVLDLDEAEVAALRAAREAVEAERAGRVVPPTVMQHLSFRLEPEYLHLLEVEAARRRLKRTAYARQLFCDALTNQQLQTALLEELRGEVQRLAAEVERLRGDLGELLYQVLTLGLKADPNEARQWVGELFGPER